jgi:hypothetical protein
MLVIPVIIYRVDIKFKGNGVLVQIHVTFFFTTFHFVLCMLQLMEPCICKQISIINKFSISKKNIVFFFKRYRNL